MPPWPMPPWPIPPWLAPPCCTPVLCGLPPCALLVVGDPPLALVTLVVVGPWAWLPVDPPPPAPGEPKRSCPVEQALRGAKTTRRRRCRFIVNPAAGRASIIHDRNEG